MDVIEASSVSMKTMADGTLRLSVDIEPRNAKAAFELFSSPGTPMALAALRTAQDEQTEESQGGSSQAEPEKPKGGELSKWCALRCRDPEFWRFLAHISNRYVTTAEDAAAMVRALCGVESRAELDSDREASELFHRVVRGPWQKWCLARGVTA